MGKNKGKTEGKGYRANENRKKSEKGEGNWEGKGEEI